MKFLLYLFLFLVDHRKTRQFFFSHGNNAVIFFEVRIQGGDNLIVIFHGHLLVFLRLLINKVFLHKSFKPFYFKIDMIEIANFNFIISLAGQQHIIAIFLRDSDKVFLAETVIVYFIDKFCQFFIF